MLKGFIAQKACPYANNESLLLGSKYVIVLEQKQAISDTVAHTFSPPR